VVGERAAAGVFVDEVQFLQPEMNFKLRFPAGWKTQNANTYVGAVSPDEDAAVILEIGPQSKDPVTSGRAFLAEKQLKLGEPEAMAVNGHEAARVSGVHQGRSVVLTWILHQDTMYRITAIAPQKQAGIYVPKVTAASDSFDTITAADRGKVREKRVRLFTAGGGESLADVVRRAGSEEKLELVAVINGIQVSTALDAGQLLKIPVSESYP
jgi:predicted Zn-dependent protease